MIRGGVLVLTVGTGNMEYLESTLLTPLAKSVSDGEWCEVVLLPSQVTATFAESLGKRFPDLPVGLCTLPNPGMENDADACFAHFDSVLGRLMEKGYRKEEIVVDFTRGTKGMSAALVLAAVRRDIPQMRYIYGPRDKNGSVIPGEEKIAKLNTVQATGRRLLDDARRLMHEGDFAAVVKLLSAPSGLPDELQCEASMLTERANFYGAWDRLAYGEAAELGRALSGNADLHLAISWTKQLADAPRCPNYSDMSCWLRKVACDLLGNGRRRIRDQHFEDALLRAYRVLELIGQFRLFDLGYDTSSIDPQDDAVKNLEERLRKKGSHGFGKNSNGRYTAAREIATKLLKDKGDPLGKELFDFGIITHGGINTKQRNHSILIHGFEAAAAKEDESTLNALYDDLRELLCRADEKAKSRLDQLHGWFTGIDIQCRVFM